MALARDTLILFPGGEDAVIHTQPAAHGLFQFIRQAIARDNFRPVVSAGAQRDGPEAIVEAVRFCTELERGRNARVVKPDICLNEINGALLRPALLDGGALRQFPNWTSGSCVRVLRNSFITTTSAFRTTPAAHMPTGRSYRRVPCVILPSQGASIRIFPPSAPSPWRNASPSWRGPCSACAPIGAPACTSGMWGQPGHGSALP